MTRPAPATLKIRIPPRLREAIEESAREHGGSLNAEIVARLEKSFEPGFIVDTTEMGFKIVAALEALNAIQGKALDLADKLQQSEDQIQATKIAHGVGRAVESIFSSTVRILTTSKQEPSK